MSKFQRSKLSLKESEVTAESAFYNRRDIIKAFTAMGASAALPASAGFFGDDEEELPKLKSLPHQKNKALSTDEPLTSEYSVTHHNNFYEFGLGKDDPAKYAKDFNTSPWTINISGECAFQGNLQMEDVLKKFSLEERIYRLRCVEAWSMVVPWIGFQLSDLIKFCQPNSKAKYVEFKTLLDPKQMPGQRKGVLGFSSLDYPYVEGLRMDEALNPLTLMSVGLYGKVLPNQNGAPIRLVVPWKYGFKSIKSIVSIRFSEQQPINSWNKSMPNEYGFYANVNPNVAHPRWSQAKERRIVDRSLFSVKRIPTRLFNGYAEQVADLYKGMDLSKFF